MEEKLNDDPIHELGEHLSRRICTGQVIISLAGACRELIDNALDAGATNIEIRTTDNGLEAVEVIDNGSGISPSNFDKLCKPHCTSKLAMFEDFQSLTTFGFRGEALNALAALSDVEIKTCDATSQCATRLTFSRNGELLTKETCSRSRGTTVKFVHLFKPLPVRRQELQRQARREFLRMIDCVQAFALCRTDCRFTFSNTINGKRTHILSTPGGLNTKLPDVLSSLFGGTGKNDDSGLLKVEEVPVPSEECCQLYGVTSNSKEITFEQIRISGYVSNCGTGQGRSSADRQFIFVNRRHVDFPKLCRIANEVYSSYNRGRYCTLVLFVDLPPNTLDVNISPDKRTVFLHHEKEVFAKLRACILTTFARWQGVCPVGIGMTTKLNGEQQQNDSGKTKKRRQMATLLRWKDNLEEKTEPPECDNAAGFRSYLPAQTQQSADLSYLSFEEGKDHPNEQEERAIDSNCNDSFGSNENTLRGEDAFESIGGSVIIERDQRGDKDNLMAKKMLDFAKNSTNTNPEDKLQNFLDENRIITEEKTILDEEDEFSQILQMSSSDEDDAEEEKLEKDPTEKLTRRGQGSNAEDEDISFLAERSFHPEESPNLRDSFVLAETPNRIRDNPNTYRANAKGVTGFVSAATLFATTDGDKDKSSIMHSTSKKSSDEHCDQSPQKKKSRLDRTTVLVDTPRRSRSLNNSTTGQKALEAFSFQCLRPGGINAVLKERQSHQQDEQRTERVEIDEIAEIQCTATTSQSPNVASPSFQPSQSLYRPQQFVEVDMSVLKRNFLHRCDLKKKFKQQIENEQHKQRVNLRIRTSTSDCNSQEEEDREAVERRLSLMLKKSHFARMTLIGQFNNAFILARLGAEVFIIDQHAADEKFNFERLMAKCIIKSQKLIRPQRIQLGSVNAGLLRDNLHVFRANGFDFEFVDEDNEIVEDGVGPADAVTAGGSVLLTAIPVHQGWNLNRDDIDQLLSMIAEMPGTLHRPKKVRKIFASKACRYSAMFGKTLTRRDMETIIRHMGTMDQPWNCPHGRPTIRHLCTMEKK